MRAGRDAIFAIVGLFAGTGISSFWRIAPVDVLRCAVPPPDLAPEPGGGEWAEPAPLSAADVAALPAAGTVSAPRQERPRALLRLSAGGRMASRPREGVDPLTPQVPPAQHWDVSHSLSFGELWTEQWTRRYSFGPVRLLNASVWPPMFAVEIRRELLTPTAGAPAAGRVAPFSNEGRVATGGACGDSLRVRFMSREALFAPLRIEERAANCGEYLVVFRPPALEPGLRTRYSLEMRLLHVDGEGLADPPSSLQLYKREFDGPNRPFWSIVSCNASCHESGPRFFNADLHVDGELAVLSPPLEAEALEAMGAALPLCTDGESDGAYLRSRDPFWPVFEGEPWAWVPFECKLRHFAPELLRECLEMADRVEGGPAQRRLPGVRFLGESTLMDAMRLWLVQLRPGGSDWHWPMSFPSANPEDPSRRNLMRELMAHSQQQSQAGLPQLVAAREQHGTRILLAELREWAKGRYADGPRALDPLGASAATVLGQAHNDAMKSSFSETRQNLFEILRLLRSYALKNPDRRFVWVTGPPRHYKEKHSPGHTECRAGRTRGNTRSCRAPITSGCEYSTDLDDGQRVANGPLSARFRCAQKHAEPEKWFAVLLFNTLDRVRRMNQYAAAEVKRALGHRAAIVDYYKLADPLPVAYSLDGVHYGCEAEDLFATRDGPDSCRGLANAVLANVLANAICNPRMPAADDNAAAEQQQPRREKAQRWAPPRDNDAVMPG